MCDFGDLIVVEMDHAPRMRNNRHDVGRDERLVVAQADDQRTAAPRRDHQIIVSGEQDGECIGPFQPLQCVEHGVARRQPLFEQHIDQQRDDLAVGLARRHAAGGDQPVPQFIMIFNDSIVDDNHAFSGVRVGVGIGRGAVESPSGYARCRLFRRSARLR